MKNKFILVCIIFTLAVNSVFAISHDADRNIFESAIEDINLVHRAQLKIIPIYYGNVHDIYKFLTNKTHSVVSNIGTLTLNTRLRQIWIKDDVEHIAQVEKLIKKLDVPTKQVLIKARIVNIETHSLRELGISFESHILNKTKEGLLVDLPKTATNQFMFPFIKLKANTFIDLKLNALEQTGHAQILAKPELTTLNHETAFIQSGEEVPYAEKTQTGGTSITFKKAALQLKVTPEILPNDKILLKLSVNQDKISTINVAGTPSIHTQKIQTKVLVDNQQTIALGGIFEEMDDKSQRSIPFLSKIPILGFLFKHHTRGFSHKELIIFVTPSIL
jgi:type IV pilus assembly protein PilQ